MKATELTIDDWVWNHHNQKPEKVMEIHETGVMLDYNDIYGYDEIEPIRLTKEILMQNKFEARGDGSFTYTYSYGWFLSRINCRENGDNCLLQIDYGDIRDCLQCVKLKIEHIHELQHALRMCKLDMVIVL